MKGALLALASAVLLTAPVVALEAESPDPGLQFSTDGSSWSPVAPTAVFAEGIHLVPGESTETTVRVRNVRADAGVLVVVVENIRAQSEAGERGFHIAGVDERGEGLPRTAIADVPTCAAVIPARSLAPGAGAVLDLTVDLDASLSGDEAQNEKVMFDLWFGLTDAAAADLTEDGCPTDAITVPAQPDPEAPADPDATPDAGALPPVVPAPGASAVPHGPVVPGDGLAATGATGALAVMVLGFGIGGAGWLLLMLSRRRRRRA